MLKVITDSKILSQVSTKVLLEEEKSLKDTLFEFLDSDTNYNAVGISAIQLGIPKSAFAYRAEESHGNMVERKQITRFVVNPEILTYDGNQFASVEGCLSVPNVKYIVKRYPQIYVKDNEGEYILVGEEAIVFQHEYDHTKGILIDTVGTIVPRDIKRNDPCPCDSGKKWKKCCGANIF